MILAGSAFHQNSPFRRTFRFEEHYDRRRRWRLARLGICSELLVYSVRRATLLGHLTDLFTTESGARRQVRQSKSCVIRRVRQQLGELIRTTIRPDADTCRRIIPPVRERAGENNIQEFSVSYTATSCPAGAIESAGAIEIARHVGVDAWITNCSSYALIFHVPQPS